MWKSPQVKCEKSASPERAVRHIELVGAQTGEGAAVELAVGEGRVVAEELSHFVHVGHGDSSVRQLESVKWDSMMSAW